MDTESIAAVLREVVGERVGTLTSEAIAGRAAAEIGGYVAGRFGLPHDHVRAVPEGDPARGEFGVLILPVATARAAPFQSIRATISGGTVVRVEVAMPPVERPLGVARAARR